MSKLKQKPEKFNTFVCSAAIKIETVGFFMFLRKNYSKKTDRTHLAIVQGYRDTDGKNKHSSHS